MTGTIGELTCFISPMDVKPAFKAVRTNNNFVPKIKKSEQDVKSHKIVLDQMKEEEAACDMFESPCSNNATELLANNANKSTDADSTKRRKDIQECNDLSDVLNLDLDINI